jgi:hypothetical protein
MIFESPLKQSPDARGNKIKAECPIRAGDNALIRKISKFSAPNLRK